MKNSPMTIIINYINDNNNNKTKFSDETNMLQIDFA